MTYKEWERELLEHLRTLPKKERDEIAEYYSEMYGEKTDAGLTDNEIIENFGIPQIVAERILAESASNEDAEEKQENKKEDASKPKGFPGIKEHFKNISVAKIVGWFFLTLLVIIPIAAVVVSVLVALAAIEIAGAAMLGGGIIGAIASPFGLIIGYTGAGVFATMGACLATAGIGSILFIAFHFITKYATVTTYKIAKYIVMGRSAK